MEASLAPSTALVVSAQQVAAMVVGTITPPLILGSALGLAPTQISYLVSMALLASALGTLLQTKRRGPLGSGLLSVTGTSFSFLQPMIAAGHAGGLPLVLGMSVATAPLQILLAPFLPRLRVVFSPLVSGIVVLLIGVTLIPSTVQGIMGPAGPGAPPFSGVWVAASVLVFVLILQSLAQKWARLFGVFIAIALGWLGCALAGWVAAPPPMTAWIFVPHPQPLNFQGWLLLPYGFIYLVSLLEAMGDMTATSQLSGLPTEGASHWERLRGGILADGVTSFISGLFGALPSTTYAQNNGVIQVTGVASRRLGPLMASMLALLGLCPQVGRWITVMPPPVFSALALLLFGLIATSGLRLIAREPLGQRESLIIACSLALGLSLPANPGWLATLPHSMRAVCESGIASGGIVALLLNLVLPKPKKEMEV